jgi:hypothetical protein
MTIDAYSINDYYWLLVLILLMVIDGYSINAVNGYYISDY